METTSQRKYFKGLRALALTALFCTIALTIFIWGEALTPGDKSAIQSAKVSDNIQSAMKSDEPAPPVSAVTGFEVTKVVRDGKEIDTDKYYIGDKVRLSVNVLPENADTSDLYFVAGKDAQDLSVSEDGEVEFTSWGWRRVLVKSRKNPSVILFDKQLKCSGVNPDTVTSISATIRKVGATEDTDVLQIGDEYVLGIFTDNGLETSTAETRLFINGEKTRENEYLYFLPAKQFFYPRAEGTVDLKFEYAGKTAKKTVTIVPGKIPPASFTFTDSRVTKNTDGSFSLTMEKGEHIKNIINELGFSPLNKDKEIDDNCAVYFDYETSNGKIVNCAAYNLHAYKPGTATITYTSLYDKNIKATLHVTVPDVVDGLTVVAPDRCVKGGKIDLNAYTGGNVTKNVKWEVVKGEGSIDKNGVFTSDKSGKVTVRATYVGRPDLTVEKTITVSVFDTFHTLIRKGLGHFSLFLVLGFGLFGTFFLLIKPRWASLPLSLLSAFVVAGISEMFQLPVFTSGRYATWQDVAIDFLGALSGIGIAVVAVSIVGLIWFKAKPESFKNMKNEFSFLTFKASFKKQEKIFTDEN
ncbi:putative uncharacterized protein [Clostridium sp. CAG:349]|nr:putative uncharacterized protein [Clostridium sp. CAG:349]